MKKFTILLYISIISTSLFSQSKEYRVVNNFGEDGHTQWAKIEKDSMCGFINRGGDIIIPCEFDSLSIFEIEHNIKWIRAKKDGLYGFLNINGDIIIPFEFTNSYQINSKYPNLINKSVGRSEKDLTKLLQENNIEDIKRAIRDIGTEIKRPLSKKEQRELSRDIDKIIKNISNELSNREPKRVKVNTIELIGDSTDR